MRYRGGYYQGVRYRGKRRPNYLLWGAAAASVLALTVILTPRLLALRPEPAGQPDSSTPPPNIVIVDSQPENPEPEPPPAGPPAPEVVVENTGYFELPVEGTHGIALAGIKVFPEETSSKASSSVTAGTPFTILREGTDRVLSLFKDGSQGWVAKDYIMVNLPDIIPSIIYEDSNADSSLMKSLGEDLEGITGKKLYDAKVYNEKLNQEQYIMPVQYHMALKIMDAQRAAKEQGLTIVLYEGFRPYDTQTAVANALKKCAANNPDTKASIQKNGFNISYYINTELSSHQTGSAVDVSLAQVWAWEERSYFGNTVAMPGEFTEFSYGAILTGGPDGVQFSSRTKYRPDLPDDTAFWMPTPMHELSYLSGTFTGPTATYTHNAWKSALSSGSVKKSQFWTDGAQKLQDIFTGAGMDPLASEWWHFNDIEARTKAKNAGASGAFEVGTESFSVNPAEFITG